MLRGAVSRDATSGASYRVGYGRPPKEHRFQPGQSGNRKGRPKGAKNTATLLREILDRKIEVRTGSTVRKISVREAILTRFAEFALKGDTKSAAFLLQRYDMLETARASEQRYDAGRARNHRRVSGGISEEKRFRQMTNIAQAFHDAILRRNFELFLRRCLMTLNPGSPYLPNWHIAAIAYQLERIRRGEITRLIINMPPRHLKSLTVSVAFPAYLLGHEPWHRIFAISYGSELSSKHASDFRSIVESRMVSTGVPQDANCAKSGRRGIDHRSRIPEIDIGIWNADRAGRRHLHH